MLCFAEYNNNCNFANEDIVSYVFEANKRIGKNSDYDFFFHWQLNPFNYNFRKGVQENLLKFFYPAEKIFFVKNFYKSIC